MHYLEDEMCEDKNIVMEEEIEYIENKDEKEIEMKEPFNPKEISVLPRNDTLRNIIERLRNDEIDLNTEFQRHADLWKDDKMSRLIESVLIRLPLPAFYFDASDDDKWLVVDGLQRLSAFKKFVVDKALKLKGLEYLTEYSGKCYEDLPRMYKRRIDECPVTLFLIQPGTPKEVKFSLFRRINTGGLYLNDQEIRNAMTKPSIRNWLDGLSHDEFLIKTIGDQSKRMKDKELILRFFAFYSMDFGAFKKNITQFLDVMNEQLEHFSDSELCNYRSIFCSSMKRCYEIFGSEAFEKKTSSTSGSIKKNSSLFEVWSVAMAKISVDDFKVLLENKDKIVEKHMQLIENDNDYVKSITYSTQKKSHYDYRHEAVTRLLKEIYNA